MCHKQLKRRWQTNHVRSYRLTNYAMHRHQAPVVAQSRRHGSHPDATPSCSVQADSRDSMANCSRYCPQRYSCNRHIVLCSFHHTFNSPVRLFITPEGQIRKSIVHVWGSNDRLMSVESHCYPCERYCTSWCEIWLIEQVSTFWLECYTNINTFFPTKCVF